MNWITARETNWKDKYQINCSITTPLLSRVDSSLCYLNHYVYFQHHKMPRKYFGSACLIRTSYLKGHWKWNDIARKCTFCQPCHLLYTSRQLLKLDFGVDTTRRIVGSELYNNNGIINDWIKQNKPQKDNLIIADESHN